MSVYALLASAGALQPFPPLPPHASAGLHDMFLLAPPTSHHAVDVNFEFQVPPPIPRSEILLAAFFVSFCTPHNPDCFHSVFTLPPHSSHPPPIPNLLASHSVCGAITTKVCHRPLCPPARAHESRAVVYWRHSSFTATCRAACARLQILPSSPATACNAGAAQRCP